MPQRYKQQETAAQLFNCFLVACGLWLSHKSLLICSRSVEVEALLVVVVSALAACLLEIIRNVETTQDASIKF